MTDRVFNVLFLCTGNSARSILAEYLLRHLDPRRFEVVSAGARPSGKVHPMALSVLREVWKIEPTGARSKSWEEFKDAQLDLVITVCDNARESCPYWPGQPIVAHWGLPDPTECDGGEAEQLAMFKEVARVLSRRLELLVNLPIEKLDRLRLEERIREIGIRMALGARRDDVRRLLLFHIGKMGIIGGGIGLAAALALGRLGETLLFGVEGTDLRILAGTIAGVSTVIFAAAIVPTRRATRVEPMVALRAD